MRRLPRRLLKGDIIRPREVNGDHCSATGLMEIVGYNSKMEQKYRLGPYGKYYRSVHKEPHWIMVRPYGTDGPGSSYWAGWFELDPFLGNAWRAKQQITESKAETT